MAQEHLLKCKCGHDNVVRSQQAGSVQACVQCGHMQQIPQLRSLRELPVASAAVAAPSSVGWGLGRGVCFSTGLALLLVGLWVAGNCAWQRSQLDVSRPDPIDKSLFLQIEALDPLQAWTLWESARDRTLFRNTPRYLMNRERSAVLLKYAMAGSAIAGAGLLLIFGTFLIRGVGASDS